MNQTTLLAKGKTRNLIEWLDRCPPFVVYYLRRPGKAGRSLFPNRVVCSLAKMSERKFVRISQKISWATVEAGDIESFCDACGFDFFNLRERRYHIRTTLRSGTFMNHVRPSMREKFYALWKKWKEAKASAAPTRQSLISGCKDLLR